MFLVHALAIVVFVYACGAIVAESLLTSPAERQLPAAARAVFGILAAIVWFAASWQFLSIGQSWLLGVAVLLAMAVGRARASPLRFALRAHARACAAIVAGALLFFTPLMAADEYGPFTEGSGDLTIYSDASKLMTDRGLTSFGQPPSLRAAASNVRSMLDFTVADRFERYAALRAEVVASLRDRLDPPAAEYGANRLLANLFFSSIFYAPYAAFQPVSGETNYPAFFAVEAFFYAAMLACLWHFFRPFGRFPAALALALAASSHSLVSVHYNAYSMQAISLATAAAMLVAATRIPLASRAGARVYGFGTLVVWLCYTHYMSIIAALLVVAAAASLPRFGVEPAPTSAPPAARAPALRVAHGIALAVSLGLVGLLFVAGSAKAVDFLSELVMGLAGGARNEYLGDRIAGASWQWFGFAFGLFSQQHLPPFAAPMSLLAEFSRAGVVAGVAALVLGMTLAARWAAQPDARSPLPRAFALALYALLLATIAIHLALAQSSLYTQAKGAQNLLVLVHAALVLPLALAWKDPAFAPAWLRWAAAAALVAFAAASLVPRVVLGARIARGADRASIMDRSYFDAARAIRAADAAAFVLFEPRKSADLYLGIQPFFGARLVPTRHLVLDRLVAPGRSLRRAPIAAASLVGDEDVAHLWWLAYEPTARAWRAQRLQELRDARIVLLGDDYEAASASSPAYVRNGDVLIFVPAARALSVRVELKARDARDAPRLARWIARDGAAGAIAAAQGDSMVIRRGIDASSRARVIRLAGFPGEFWADVRVEDARPG